VNNVWLDIFVQELSASEDEMINSVQEATF
jgi:hypothetical protein